MKVLSESRDPAIKLFGKTIPLIPSSAIGEAAAATDAHKVTKIKWRNFLFNLFFIHALIDNQSYSCSLLGSQFYLRNLQLSFIGV